MHVKLKIVSVHFKELVNLAGIRKYNESGGRREKVGRKLR